MKQFWLGMTSKMAEMRDKAKSKLSGKNPDDVVVEESEEITPKFEEVLYEEPVIEYAQEVPVYKEKKPIRWWKVILSLVLLIVFGSVGGVFYYVSNIDWNEHKDKIAAQFSELTGKRIEFEGAVQLSILPSPYLLAQDIKIYNPGENGGEPLAKIKSLVANLSLMPLINGDFDVKMMELKEPDIRFEIMEDGTLNWESSFTEAQRQNLENVKISLDSVMIEKAKFNFIDEDKKIDLHLDNLNAEIIAESVFGPYRIEGSYIKDNNPEGFAFSIGKLSNGFATNINMVVNQPASETFVRFDGSVLPQNKAINGNLILESKKLMDFINSNFNDFQLKKEYDYPLAVSLEIKSNKTKIDFTNFVMKYGETAGAGNLLIPLNDVADASYDVKKSENYRPKVELSFNFTDLDLTPAVALVKELAAKYNTGDASYSPELPFDLLADFKSLKTQYLSQAVKDFHFSFDMVDNNLKIRELSGVVPGDTVINATGDIYSDLGHLTYNFDGSMKSDEFQQTLQWLSIPYKANSDTAYKRISLNLNAAGTFDKISINPLEMSLDKTTFNGEIGILTGARPNIFLRGKADMINFDTYIKPLPKEEVGKSLAERMAYRFSKLGFLNNYEANIDLALDLGIYENSPFENAKLQADIKRGVMNIRNFDLPSVVTAAVNVKGLLKGFGQAPEFENLKYDFSTKDVTSFISKTDIKTPDINFKNLKNFSAKGIATGFLNKLATKSILKLENININYGGQINQGEDGYAYNGDLEVKSPDFVKMLNDFNIGYDPKAFALGLFNLKTKFVGNALLFKAENLNVNVGPNNFVGKLTYDGQNARPIITTDLKINRLELEKFFYNNSEIKNDNKQNFRAQPGTTGKADFMMRPSWDNVRLNYDFYKGFDLSGNFSIERMTFRDIQFDYVEFGLDLKDALAKLNNFKTSYHGGMLTGNLELNMATDKAVLTGHGELEQYKITDGWKGDKYGFKEGIVNLNTDFTTDAESFASLLDGLSGKIDLTIYNAMWNGWNFGRIHSDLTKRESSDGLTMMIKNNLSEGEQKFEEIKILLDINRGKYTLNDASLNFGEGMVTYSDNGDLNSWETNAVFNVKYHKPDYLPGFGFKMNGAISSPAIEPDTEELAIMYNNRKAEMDAQEESKRQAERDFFSKKMKDQILLVNGADSELQNVVKSELLSRKELAKSPEVIANYKQLEEDIEIVEAIIAEQNLLSKTPEIDDALLLNMSDNNRRISTKIKEIKNSLTLNQVNNLKYIINDAYNKITEQNNEAKKIAEVYRNEYSDFGKRLAQINTIYNLTDDENIRRLRNKIEGNLLALDNITGSVQSDFVRLQGSRDMAQLDKYASDISIMLIDAGKYVPAIKIGQAELSDYAEQRVKIEEDAYRKKQEDEEIKRKLQENTGKISVKGTGVSKTVVRDIAEIEKSEEAVDQEKVGVIDFSEPEPSVNKIYNLENPKKDIITPTKEEDAIIVKPQGTITKATGVIIRK